ncbi:MAG: sugar kinase [Gaiellaceae bacterium]
MTARALTAGETMALLDPLEDDIAAGTTFRLRVAGAESNFAIALTRLGVKATWVSRLGADPFGDVVGRTLAAEGLDLQHVRRDPERPTGLYFKSRSGTATRVFYYRSGSAASALSPADVPDELLDGVALVHLTGITAALSSSARELVLDLGRRARARGIAVLFDPNYRAALWESPAAAAASLDDVLPSVDWYLCGLEEGNVLFGTRSPEELVEAIVRGGAGAAAVRVGARGALVPDGSTLVEVAPPRLEAVRDEIGAGDGFAAGFAYGLLHGWNAPHCALAGNVVAAAALRGTGDWETYPRLDEFRALLEEQPPR